MFALHAYVKVIVASPEVPVVSAVRVEPTFSVPVIATTAVGAVGSTALALEIPETPIDKVRNAISNVRKSLLAEFVGF